MAKASAGSSPSLPKDLIEAAADRRLVPFVGAGVSLAVRGRDGKAMFPNWVDLLRRAVTELEANKRQQDAALVKALLELETPDLLDAARRARDGLKNRWGRFLAGVFDRRRDELDDATLALPRAIWGLGSPLVMTTNFDSVLRWACHDEAKSVHIEDGALLGDALAHLLKSPCIWHLHGHIDKPEELVLTPAGYQALYGSVGAESQHRAALNTLRSFFASHHFLFVGFSFEDRSLGAEVDWVNDAFGESSRQHYILVREQEASRVRSLVSRNVEVVTYAAHGQPLLDVLRVLAEESSRGRRSESRKGAEWPERLEMDRRAFVEARRDGRFDDVFKLCQLRYGEGRVARYFGPPPFHEYVRVQPADQADLYFPVAFAPQGVDGALVEAFIEKLLRPARLRAVDIQGKLIDGSAAVYAVSPSTSTGGVDIVPLMKFEEVIDFAPYLEAQRVELEADKGYNTQHFVAQKIAYREGPGQRESEDAPAMLRSWIEALAGRLIVILGVAGSGKTFLVRQHALHQGAPGARIAPLLVPLRQLERAHSLDQLLAAHFERRGKLQYHREAFRYLLERGRVALLFDGFDELAVRVGFERAADHLETLVGAAAGRAKVVVTSRKEHFLTSDQVLTPLGKGIERASYLVAELCKFDRDRVKRFLVNRYEDNERAAARQKLMEEVHDISGLAETPRLLSFITEQVTDEELVAAKRRGEQVTAASLYQRVLEKWLSGQQAIAETRGSRPGLGVELRWRLAERLAIELWVRVDRTVSLAALNELAATVLPQAELPRLSEHVHEFGSRSLLIREGDGAFSFIHQSILEWLVASAAAREVRTGERSGVLGQGSLTELMIEFLVDLAGAEPLAQWAEGVLSRSDNPREKANALAVTQKRGLNVSQGKNLAGQDLRGRDFSGADLSQADLRGARLSRARLAGADLRGARLEGADLSFSNLVGARLHGARCSAQTQLLAAKLTGTEPDPEALQSAESYGAALPGVPPGAPSVLPAFSGPLAVSPDGRWLAAASGMAVSVIELHEGTVVRLLEGHVNPVSSVAFSHDSRSLASGSYDNTVRIWDIASGKNRILEGHSHWVTSVAFSHDGSSLASGSHDNTVRIWDIASGKNRLLEGHSNAVTSVTFSHDDRSLASGSYDNTVRIWDIASGKDRLLEGHLNWVTSVAFSHDGRSLASGSEDNTVRIWDVASGKDRVLEGHSHWVTSVAFNHDSRSLASGSHDNTVRIWDIASGKDHILEGHSNTVMSVAFGHDGRSLASGSSDNTLRIWDIASGKDRVLEGHSHPVTSVAYSHDRRSLASGSEDNTVRLWDLVSGKDRVFEGHSHPVTSVAFSHDGRSLASGSWDDTMRVWDIASGKDRVLEGHSHRVTSVAFSRDGRSLVSGSHDNTVRIWDLASGKARVLKGHSSPVTSVVFGHDSRSLASGSHDNTVRIWDIALGKGIVFDGHTHSVTSVAFSYDGRSLASGSYDNTVRIWDIASGKHKVLEGHSHWVTSVAFSHDSCSLASGSYDNTVRIWDIASGKVRVLDGHTHRITSVAFSHDSRSLASGSHDNTVRIWDIVSGRCLLVLVPTRGGSAAFLPDGRYRVDGDIGRVVWHSIGLCRFELGELEKYYPLRLRDDEPLLAP